MPNEFVNRVVHARDSPSFSLLTIADRNTIFGADIVSAEPEIVYYLQAKQSIKPVL